MKAFKDILRLFNNDRNDFLRAVYIAISDGRFYGCAHHNLNTHPDVFGMFTLSDANHPQELIDVITRVANHTPEYNQDVVDIQGTHDFISLRLIGRHGLADL